MDKREIIIRLVDTDTGLIFNETRKAIKFRFRMEKDRNDLHAILDEFIRVLRDSPADRSYCLDFISDAVPVEMSIPGFF